MTASDRQQLDALISAQNSLREPLIKRCRCGRRISNNKAVCASCAVENSAAAAGLILPGGVIPAPALVRVA